jgi:ubiquitin-like 1-activating enzyme E1 A
MLAAHAAFEAKVGRSPTAEDCESVLALLPDEATRAGVSDADMLQQAQRLARAAAVATSPSGPRELRELAPVCAVCGGVVANNVIRALSHSGAPLHNLFMYSLHDGRGVVELRPRQASGPVDEVPERAAPKVVAIEL